jgi:hypothetical protein
MSSRDITIAGYAAFVALLLGLHLWGSTRRSRIPSLGQLFSRAMRTRSGRVGIVAGWVWVGLHFFAR